MLGTQTTESSRKISHAYLIKVILVTDYYYMSTTAQYDPQNLVSATVTLISCSLVFYYSGGRSICIFYSSKSV